MTRVYEVSDSAEAGRLAAYDAALDIDSRDINDPVPDAPEPLAVAEEEKRKVSLFDSFSEVNSIPPEQYARFDVKRGLRNADGTGVMVGMTNISDVHGYRVQDGEENR